MKVLLDVVAVVIGLIAVAIVVQLVRNGRSTFDDRFTPSDRRLAGAAVFYLAVPVALALQVLAHAFVLRALGGEVDVIHFLFFWAEVKAATEPAGSTLATALAALAGIALTLAVAFFAIRWTVRRPVNAAWNFARLELGRVLLWLALVIHPIGSLALGIGDFAAIRDGLSAYQQSLGEFFVLAYGTFAVVVFRKWNGSWRHRYVWLATSLYDRLAAAERRVRLAPEDPQALRELGRTYLAADQPVRAERFLGRAAAALPDDPEVQFLAGTASLRARNPHAASEHLRAAGLLLEEQGGRPDLLFEVTLGLAAARLALADPMGALSTADAARAQRPLDPRAVLVHADALLAVGRGHEAKGRLEALLEDADGPFAAEIKRRLRAIS